MKTYGDTDLKLLALNCSLKSRDGQKSSSTEKMIDDFIGEMELFGVQSETYRAVDFDIRPGVLSDMGDGDEWPTLRKKILNCDIFLFGLPIWLGQPSSVAKRVMERMDAFLGETDEKGRMPAVGKVAVVAIVGNEDGAHHCHAACFQALNDVGFTIPANGGIYWVGEAMGKTDYQDLEVVPSKVRLTMKLAASNVCSLAHALKARPYSGLSPLTVSNLA